VRTAVLGAGATVQVAKAGDTFASFVIKVIDAESVELANPSTGQSFRISLQ
jgi:hypothetical protein